MNLIEKVRKHSYPLFLNVTFGPVKTGFKSILLSYRDSGFSGSHYLICNFRLYCYINEQELYIRIVKIRKNSFKNIADFNDHLEYAFNLFIKKFNANERIVNKVLNGIEKKELKLILLAEILNLDI